MSKMKDAMYNYARSMEANANINLSSFRPESDGSVTNQILPER